MTKLAICIQSFKSIDNYLAKLRKGSIYHIKISLFICIGLKSRIIKKYGSTLSKKLLSINVVQIDLILALMSNLQRYRCRTNCCESYSEDSSCRGSESRLFQSTSKVYIETSLRYENFEESGRYSVLEDARAIVLCHRLLFDRRYLGNSE